jgi:hypothetical protein
VFIDGYDEGLSQANKLKDHKVTYETRYNEDLNRCFVEARSSFSVDIDSDASSGLPKNVRVFARRLFDVQTQTKIAECIRWPLGFPEINNYTPSRANTSTDVACAYIDKMMLDNVGEGGGAAK